MTENKDSTEQKILDAAHEVFIRKGLDGSRMQQIANQAGINKALLHYYFRTKQKLFEAIFKDTVSRAFPDIRNIIFSDMPIEKKIQEFIDRYIDLMLKNPYIPFFILKEINRDPENIANIIQSQGLVPTEILKVFEREMEAGRIRRMNTYDLITNLIALSIFPFAAKPLLSVMLFNGNEKAYKEFLINRKSSVKDFVLNSIIIK